jgi:putative restriction endonuclease
MPLGTLLAYTKQFAKLRRAHTFGGAPHKPILLLSILHLFEQGVIKQNRIEITPQLVSTFKDFWRLLVTTPHTPNFSLPFYHLKSEPFWHLVVKPGHQLALTKSHSIKSFSALKDAVGWASFDTDLFKLLEVKENLEILRLTILEYYFGGRFDPLVQPTAPYLFQLQNEMLNESAEEYQTRFQEIQQQLNKEELEEETFVRDGAFKQVISNLYQHTCAISGLRIIATENISMIDGCHIKPWSICHDDTAPNGISLCPNLHRAFDRGLLSIDEDYRTMISPHFTELSTSPYQIKQFTGQQILLPSEIKHYPSQTNLAYHRKHIFIK